MQTQDEIKQSVVELYVATFNRAPDAAGLDYWVSNIVDKSWSINDVAYSMFQSSEVSQTYSLSLSNTNFLNAVYNNVLGRAGDADGIAYWLNEMAQGTSRDSMIITIINGAKADTGSADDKLVLQNKTEVGVYFSVTKALEHVETAYSILENVTKESSTVVDAKDLTDIYIATAAGSSVIKGTSTADNIDGTSAADYIYSFAGDDTILAYDGANYIVSGAGADAIYSGTGIDTIYSRDDDDTIYAGDGADIIYGGSGADSIHGEAGNDTIYGEAGNDYIYGEAGDDTIDGGDGADTIYGGDGADTIYGSAGADTINGGDGANFVDGGTENDIIYGGADKDIIYGGTGDDTIYGYDGADTLDGLSGDDTIFGGNGDDNIVGNSGVDTLYGAAGADTIYGEAGVDTIYGGVGADTLSGGSEVDTFVFEVLDSTLVSLDVITDFEFNSTTKDKLTLADGGTEDISATQTSVITATTLTQAVDIAAAGDGSTNAIIKWFVYEDNTYLVEDLSADATLNATQDIIIKFQGIVDLTGIDTDTITFV